MARKGLLVTFEGVDGSGKSTQASLAKDYLVSRGFDVRLLREPGGTVVGERIRSILLDAAHGDMTPRAELFLYLAARAQITGAVILPALEAGGVVVMDRFIDSTTAYQGFARGLGMETAVYLNRIATGGLNPDLTIVVDTDPETCMSRIGRTRDRLESEGLVFMEKVREGFLRLRELEPDRVKVVDGNRDVDAVFGDVRSLVEGVLGECNR